MYRKINALKKNINRTSSARTRKWIKITFLHSQPDLKKQKTKKKKTTYFSHIRVTLPIQVTSGLIILQV